MRNVSFKAGDTIIAEGDDGDTAFFIVSGSVEVIVGHGAKARAVGMLQTGEVFGEMSLINHQPTSATVRAARRSTILFLERDYFQRLIQALPEIRRYFEELSERRGMESQLVLGSETIEVAEEDAEELPVRRTENTILI